MKSWLINLTSWFNKEPTSMVSTEGIKLLPIAGVKGVTLLGFTLPDIVSMATLAYVIILIAYKLWTWHKEWRSKDGSK